MYWNKQEQFVFDIILFILVVFQTISFFILKTETNALHSGIFLAGINVLLFAGMIPFAKWVWKTTSYRKAFLLVAKHEAILLGLTIVGILLAILLTDMKIRT